MGSGSAAITGTASSDVLGVLGDGAHEMIGDLGDDLYYVDSADDVITELGGEGYDAVYTTVDYALPANVEKIVAVGATGLTLTGNELDNKLFGASGADTLLGGAGDDRLDGRGGIDRLVGGEGDDVYVVSTYKDVVVELADEGYDVVLSKGSFQLTDNVEELRLIGQAVKGLGNNGDNKLVGNDQNNLLSGLDGVDRLYGGAGDDTLAGGVGKDVLTGGAGADVFAFTDAGDAGDVITDFEAGVDRIQIDLAGFGLATFDATSFESNARGIATTGDARFIYAESNGRLFFDADGSGSGQAVLLATLRGAPEFTAADVSAFSVV
ncbi:hemolysin-type calcium-binding protein [Methylopila sp. Yamaguchi]|nr:hemolysin-type calcium-binding protein [Methylopila sp. Yamaguchi]